MTRNQVQPLKAFAAVPTASGFLSKVVLSLLLAVIASGSVAMAGECKVANPSKETVYDADRMADLSEIHLAGIAESYYQKTGKELRVVIVARAGQALEDQTILTSGDTRPLFARDLIQQAEADYGSYVSKDGAVDNRLVPTKGFDIMGRQVERRYLREVLEKRFDTKQKLEYSHMGFLVKDHPRTPVDEETGIKQDWMAVHMLRPCKEDNPNTELGKFLQKNRNIPQLWEQGVGLFFSDNPKKLLAWYLVPTPEIQDRLFEILTDKEYVLKLKSNFYNVAAHWQNLVPGPKKKIFEEANSNQVIAEILVAATRPKGRIQDRVAAQKALVETDFRPSTLLLSGGKALGYVPLADSIFPEFTYHSSEQPFYSSYGVAEIITANSIRDYMARNRMLVEESVLVGPPKTPPGTIDQMILLKQDGTVLQFLK